MKKRLFILLITMGLLAVGCGKTESEEIQIIPEVESSETVEDVTEEQVSQEETVVEEEALKLSFKDLEDHQF